MILSGCAAEPARPQGAQLLGTLAMVSLADAPSGGPQANPIPESAHRSVVIPPASDARELVAQVRAGHRDAEGRLFRRYRRGILFLLRRLTRDPARAEDLLQETFRIVLERLRDRGLDDPDGLAAFLQGTARRLVLNAQRKQVRRRTETAGETLPETADRAPGPLAVTLRGEQARRVRRLLADLEPARDRQVLYRFYLAEDDKQAICADLGLSSLHFNRVLYRARQRFKSLLEADGWQPLTNPGGTATP